MHALASLVWRRGEEVRSFFGFKGVPNLAWALAAESTWGDSLHTKVGRLKILRSQLHLVLEEDTTVVRA